MMRQRRHQGRRAAREGMELKNRRHIGIEDRATGDEVVPDPGEGGSQRALRLLPAVTAKGIAESRRSFPVHAAHREDAQQRGHSLQRGREPQRR